WDLLAGGWGRDVAVLDAALAEVFGTCPVSRTGFGGFSDGASYALSLGLGNGDLAEALIAFSPGFAAPSAAVGRPRVWISHGRADVLEGQPAIDLLLGGDALRAAAAEEADQPVEHRGDPALEAHDVHEVDDQPQHPGGEAAELELPDVGDRGEARDGRHRALVE